MSGKAAAAVLDEPMIDPSDAPTQPVSEAGRQDVSPEPGTTPSQMQEFLATLTAGLKQLTERQEAFERRIDERMAYGQPGGPVGYRHIDEDDEPAVAPPTAVHSDVARYTVAGLIEPPSTHLPYMTAADSMQLVAFIPKDDQLNPKNSTFDTWINCRKIQIKRGQVGMLPKGHAVGLAAADHGYVVDIELMSGLEIPRLPDYSRPDSWDGSVPQQVGSTVPPEFYSGRY